MLAVREHVDTRRSKEHDYDLCLSFAGEDRPFVSAVAKEVVSRGLRVFYDQYQEVDLWGKDLYEHLDDIYKNAARYCVIFVSKNYAQKLWTNHERKSAQERALRDNREYILPARFDKTPIPGLRDTVGYIDLTKHTPETFARLVHKKIGGHFKEGYFPPTPDLLFKRLHVRSKKAREDVVQGAHKLLWVLKRMSQEERTLVSLLFRLGCPAKLPENIHLNIDLLRRASGFPTTKIRRLLGGLSSLGFTVTTRPDDETPGRLGKDEMLVLEWFDFSVDSGGNRTLLANEMILGATENYCDEHGLEALARLDFSQLSSATAEEDKH